MNKFLNANPKYLTDSNTEGVNRVDKGYAFLMESTSIEYHTMRMCNLSKIGNALDEKGYGIAMRKSKEILTLYMTNCTYVNKCLHNSCQYYIWTTHMVTYHYINARLYSWKSYKYKK